MLLDLEPGTRVTREETNALVGGGIQGGMLTPAGGKLMLLFSDRASSETYGYTADGWADEQHSRFFYTGEGPVGPQSVSRGKNKILLESLSTDREVHLFWAVGTTPGSKQKIHEYLGQFVLNPDSPYLPETTLDQNHEPRTAIVFDLIRVDSTPSASAASIPEIGTVRTETEVAVIDRESANAMQFDRAMVDPGTVMRRERELEDQLITWLEGKGHSPVRLMIRVAGERSALYTDTWVPETRELFEVKSAAKRSDIRMAIAQLLDYRRHVVPSPERSTVLVPTAPSADLQALVAHAGLGLAVFDSRGLVRL